MDETTPRVWVGTLGLYNAGHLIGKWFDAVDAPTDVHEWVEDEDISRQILSANKESGLSALDRRSVFREIGEEVWCFDHENFDGLLKDECSPLAAKRLATLIADAGVWDLTPEHLKSYADYTCTKVEELDEQLVHDAFAGEFEKPWHYVFDYVKEFHGATLDLLPHEVESNIDWEAVTEAYEANGTLGVYFDEIAHNRCFVWRNE